MASEEFMGIILSCMKATGHSDEFVECVRGAFGRIARAHPDWVERYRAAINFRDVGEIERLLIACQKQMNGEPWIGNLRVNAVTKRFHVGNGNRSAPVFPPVTLH